MGNSLRSKSVQITYGCDNALCDATRQRLQATINKQDSEIKTLKDRLAQAEGRIKSQRDSF